MEQLKNKDFQILVQGAIFWNKYREKELGENTRPDFNDLELSGGNWRYNEIRGAEMTNCDFINTQIKELTFRESDFTESDFTNCDLHKVDFSSCNFSSIQLKNAKFRSVLWYHGILENLNFKEADYFGESYFFQCNLRKVDFSGINLKATIFENCELENVNFSNTGVTEENFVNSNKTSCTFQ